jgi:predicted phage terminase large subunit-like protein
MGTWLFNAMYQQEPAPIEGGIIKKRWLRFYTELPRVYYKLQSWDTGFKEGITDSYSVCTTWAMCKEGFFLIDVFRERMEYPKLKSAVREQYWKHTTEDDKVNVVVIEDKASGQSLIQDLKKSNRNIPIRKENKLKDKEVAAIEISGSFESGNVFIRQDAHWMDTYISELVTFPNSQYNDQMDSTSQALKWLRFKWEQFIEIKQKKNIKKRPTGRRI